jgi:hypothetical protein
MSESDVREAAGRLHRVYAGESYTDVYRDKLRADGMDGSLSVAYSLADEDRQAIAEAYLAESDPTPVDEDWLRSVGAKDDYDDLILEGAEVADGCIDLILDVRRNHLCISRRHGRHSKIITGITNPTRGQVRTAARLFGIELKEKA